MELMAYLIVAAIICIPLTEIVSSNYRQTQNFCDQQSISTLNQAVELYRLSGGRNIAHSLMGDNTPQKVESVIGVLENGIMRNGQHIRFIAPMSNAQISRISATGQGNAFTFTLLEE